MRIKFWLVPLSVVLIRPCLGAAEPPTDIYKEAQLQESTAQDPEAAIRLYHEFLKQRGTDRSLQASAYLHLGLCQAKLGRMDQAKVAWKKIVQDFSDQSDSYAEALNQLQKTQTAERERIVVVHESSPVIKVVYEAPPARWMVEFPRGTFLHTLDNKGRLVDTTAGGSLGFVHYPTPNLGVGMEVGNLGASGPPSARRQIGYFLMLGRKEMPIISGFTGYLKGGPAFYFSNFSNSQESQTKWSAGGSLEGGFTIGMLRGFAFNFGYLLHVFSQTTPTQGFDDTIPAADKAAAAEVIQNRGLRFVGGPDVSLSFRW